jgi:tetratricopeptide (TPR) repeat protein
VKYIPAIIMFFLNFNFYSQEKKEQKSGYSTYTDSAYQHMQPQIVAGRKAKVDSINKIIEKCNKLIESNPKDDKAYYMRADLKGNLARYIDEATLTERYKKYKIIIQEGINDYLEVTKLNSKYADTAYFKIAMNRQGIWQDNRDSLEKNIYYLEKAVAVNPNYTAAWMNLASHYKNDKRAIECYTKAIELNTPFITYAYCQRGKCKRNLKDYKGAIADFTKAIEINAIGNSIFKVYVDRGVTKDELKDYKGAIDDYTKALDIAPKNHSYSYYYRGNSKLKAGDKEGACLDWNKAKKREDVMGVKISVSDTISKYCK